MQLIDTDIKGFKKEIYKYYKEAFPRLERKSNKELKKLANLGICDFIKILDDKKLVGFMILNKLPDTNYAQLDYLAILKEYQNNGYGSEALKLLNEKYKTFDFIYVEIESLGFGKNEKENIERIRRDKFYRNANFIPLDYRFELYKVIYSPYVTFINKKYKYNEKDIIKKMFDLYYETIGEKYCKYIKIDK